jgi:hypothetical protein
VLLASGLASRPNPVARPIATLFTQRETCCACGTSPRPLDVPVDVARQITIGVGLLLGSLRLHRCWPAAVVDVNNLHLDGAQLSTAQCVVGAIRFPRWPNRENC